MNMFRLATCVSLVGACVCLSPVVNIEGLGKLRGKTKDVKGIEIDEFLGIRYGTARRWEQPIPTPPWNGTKEAVIFGNTCPGSLCVSPKEESEDCLFLNVYRATSQKQPKVPVMVWVHGGAYQIGCANIYSGQDLVSHSKGEVIVVTLNYRLNAFGFLGSKELTSGDGSTGNFGLQDQRLALQWVNSYIDSFGGDPNQVTLFGQSAGAGSVTCHLVSPPSRKLFQKAIPMSGFGSTWNANMMPQSESNYQTLLNHSACDSVDCLKAKSQAEISSAAKKMNKSLTEHEHLTWAPVVDGVELSMQPWQYFKEGTGGGIDIMAGTTRDEMAFFISSVKNVTEVDFDVLMKPFVHTDEGLHHLKELYSNKSYEYPSDLGDYTYWWWALVRAQTDQHFTCPHRRSMRWLVPQQNTTVFGYFFIHPTQTSTHVPGTGPGAVAVPHGSDIAYVFDCPDASNCTWPSSHPDESSLSVSMNDVYVNFAKTGNPQTAGFSPYDISSDSHFVFDTNTSYGGTGFHTIHNLRTAACDFWDGLLTP